MFTFYDRGAKLGQGAFGSVYAYTKRNRFVKVISPAKVHPEEVAVKEIHVGNNNFQDEVEKEVRILMGLDHENVVKFYESGFTEDDHLCIIMERCNGTLGDLIRAQRILDLSQVSFLAKQIYQGLAYIHKEKVIHRDVKPANILLSTAVPNGEDGWLTTDMSKVTVKLGDFGSSHLFPDEQAIELMATLSLKGTVTFMAPEIKEAIYGNKRKAHYNCKADIYSAALSMLVLFMKMFEDLPEYSSETLSKLTGLSSNSIFIDFLTKQLKKHSTERPSSAQLLKHPFLSEDYEMNAEKFRQYINHTNKQEKTLLRATSGYGTLAETTTGTRPNTINKTTQGAKSKMWSSRQYMQGETPAPEESLARPLLRASALENIVSSGLPEGFEAQLCRTFARLNLTANSG